MTTSLENPVLAGSKPPEELFERIADDLYQRGYSIIPAALPPDACVFADLNGHRPAWDKHHSSCTELSTAGRL